MTTKTYKIARLVLSQKNIYKDTNNNMQRKCIILSSREPYIFVKSKKKFSPHDLYVRLCIEDKKVIQIDEIGIVGNPEDDLNIFYHIFTCGWLSNNKLNNIFKNYLKNNSSYDNSLIRINYDYQVISVDPEGATDLDDGFYFFENDETIDFHVHIADPISYIMFNTEFSETILNEIIKRISTCYVGKSCHLLPESFVKNVSFLKNINNQDVKRSMCFIFTINKINKEIDFDIKLCNITNVHNTTYDLFQETCDSNETYKKSIYNLCCILIDKMNLNYNKNFYDNPEFSHIIIEIFMLWTNHYIGNYLYNNSDYFIVRTQEQFCEKEDLLNKPNYVTNFLNFSANYEIVDKINNINNDKTLKHFALGIQNYTHITSPMRRVIDFINHIIIYEKMRFLDNSICQNILQNLNIQNINDTIKNQKKISSSYDILKQIKNNNKFKACILNYKIINESTYALIVVYNEESSFKKILDIELPLERNFILDKFIEFDMELYYNSVNFKSSKFPFSIKIL